MNIRLVELHAEIFTKLLRSLHCLSREHLKCMHINGLQHFGLALKTSRMS